jgi:MFS family permease
MLSVPRTRKAMVGIIGAFFIQGLLAVAWLPRIPEVIDHLNVPFSAWGAIVGIAGLGGLVPLLFANRLINRWGTRPLLQVSYLVAAASIASFGFIREPIIFFIALFIQNFGYGVFNIALNSHSVVFQNRIGKVILGRFHAAWSIGAASSSLLTGFFASFVSLDFYLLVVAAVSLAVCWFASTLMLSPSEDGHEQEKKRAESVPLFKTPSYVILLAVGLFCAVMPEATMMDWSAIFAKRIMHLSPALQGAPYTLFVVSMIASRLSIGKLSKRRHLSRVGQIAATMGAFAVSIAAVLGTLIGGVDPLLSLGVTTIFWILTGLAAGPQVPSYFSMAGSVDTMTTAQAMSRMSLMNSLFILAVKVVMGGIAQGIGVPFVFVVSVVTFTGASIISGIVVKRLKSSAAQAEKEAATADQSVDAFPVTSPLAIVSESEIE